MRTELAADVPPVLGDRVQLQQVILNLVMNGIEAMRRSRIDRESCLFGPVSTDPTKCSSPCKTPASGSTRQNLEKIFDAFYTTKPQGMGMGLAISRSIVENHGGRLWAVPNDGPGATFQFTLDVGAQEWRPSDD